MALNEAECKQCQIELDKLEALPGDLADMPEAQDRIAKLKAALGGECESGSSSSDDNSNAGAAVAAGLGLVGFFVWLFGRR